MKTIKQLISAAMFLSILSLVEAAPEFIVKGGIGAAGKLSLFHEKVCKSGYGCVQVPAGSTKVSNAVSLSLEAQQFISKVVGLGLGMTYQVPRQPQDFSGSFEFVPVYGMVKLRTVPDQSNSYAYIVGQFGYNAFLGDTDFRGDGGSLDGGIYYGYGGGAAFDHFIIELLYTKDKGSAKTPICGANGCTTAQTDMEYSVYTLNVGYKWGGQKTENRNREQFAQLPLKHEMPADTTKRLALRENLKDLTKDQRLKVTLKDNQEFSGRFSQWDYNDPNKFWMKVDGDAKFRTRPFYLSNIEHVEK